MSSAAPATRRERLILYQLSAIGYLVCAALVIYTIGRWAGYESPASLALYGVTPWLYLPVYAVVGYGFRARRWALLALSSLLVIVHVVTIWPDIKPPDRLTTAAKNSPRLRVYSANLLYNNRDLSGIMNEVREKDPDIAVFQEVTSSHRARLLREPNLSDLPNRVTSPHSDTVLFSRLPIESSEIWYETWRPMVRARVSTDIGTVEVVVVHTVAPINGPAIEKWRQMLDELRQLSSRRSSPLLMVGDFNATMYHPRFGDLLDTGLTDAHSARGAGLTGTWPRDRSYPPFLRIDHALSSNELVPVKAAYGDGQGSDHRPVVVDYALIAPEST